MRIGVDLGGTKIEALAIAADGRELYRERTATPRKSYQAIVEAVASLVERVEAQCGSQGSIGIGIPGVTSPATGLVKNANTTLLIGHPLEHDLSQRLSRPVRLANDANCFALSEAVDGAASKDKLGYAPRSVFGVIIGTGTGGGVVIHGRLLDGIDGIAGEWGHNPLPWAEADELPGAACWCGHRGCLETFLSGPALERAHQERTGAALNAAEIAKQARNGDASCRATLDRYASRLARGLASVINLINPDVIVLGGGVSNITELLDTVPPLWAPYVFSDTVSTKLVRAQHGDSSGVRGAAWLWPGDSAPR